MSRHVFVDETKQRGYLLVAAVLIAGDLATARKELRALVLPGQRALHMNAERDSRRRAIADAITAWTSRPSSTTLAGGTRPTVTDVRPASMA